MCPPVASGSPVTVPQDLTVSGIDFALVRGGRNLRQRLGRDDRTARRECPSQRRGCLRRRRLEREQRQRDVHDGRCLNAGTYFVQVQSAGQYLGQTHGGIDCGPTSCPPATAGTPIAVALGGEVGGIDFLLARGSEDRRPCDRGDERRSRGWRHGLESTARRGHRSTLAPPTRAVSGRPRRQSTRAGCSLQVAASSFESQVYGPRRAPEAARQSHRGPR